MNNIDLSYICKVMENMTGIPVRVYKGDQQIVYYSLVDLPEDPIGIYIGQILAINSHISYFTTRHFNYYGIVKSGDIRLVIGPTRQTENSTQELCELAFRTGVGTGGYRRVRLGDEGDNANASGKRFADAVLYKLHTQ